MERWSLLATEAAVDNDANYIERTGLSTEGQVIAMKLVIGNIQHISQILSHFGHADKLKNVEAKGLFCSAALIETPLNC